MGMTRESKLKNVFVTPLLNNINNQVTELEVSELSFKHMFNEKEQIVGDNKGIFAHLKAVNCDTYCSSTCMIFSSIYYKIISVTEHKIINILTSISGKHCLFFKIGHSQSHFVISLVSVSQRQGKICVTELISDHYIDFSVLMYYGNGVESIWRDIMNVYEIYELY